VTGPESYVFTYGSLVADAPSSYVTRLNGFRRCWGVAMDNGETVSGYKYYVDETGSRPDVYVAFLDIRPEQGASVNGACTLVEEDGLRGLDERERNYRRVEVTDAVADARGRVWAYVGSEAGRARLERGRDSGTAVVSRDYLDGVEAGFRALGPEEYAAFRDSSDLDGLPVRDLIRVDLPA
jgi:gamma-glutamylcyclotransferase (GGCT)/AIG2-like uncharacterized protein YtfP